MSGDPICDVCNEPRSRHVATWRGPLTHRREASGEGRYVLVASGTIGGGVMRDDRYYETWEFVSSRSALDNHPRGDGSGRNTGGERG